SSLFIHQISVLFFSSRRRHTRSKRDWSSDVCSSDLEHRAQCFEVAGKCVDGFDDDLLAWPAAPFIFYIILSQTITRLMNSEISVHIFVIFEPLLYNVS